MPKILVTDSSATKQKIAFVEGDTLMEVLRDHGYEEITAICGGSCSCATCHLWVTHTPVTLIEVEEDEEALLEIADNYDPEKSRLSCQIELAEHHDGLEVQLLTPE